MDADQDRDLGRRALDAGYLWAPGALTQHGERVLVRVAGGRLMVQPDDIEHMGVRVISTDGPVIVRADDGGPRYPVFADPATLGTLGAQVRERWAVCGYLVWVGFDAEADLWTLEWACNGRPTTANPSGIAGSGEADAWVAAFEAAPGVTL